MIPCQFQRVGKAAWLPDEWDNLAGCYFQRKDFLHHTEIYNPCRQRYYLLFKDNKLLAGACVYSLSIPLFTFSRIPGKVKMTVIGLPVSVSAPGMIGFSETDKEQLLRHMLNTEKGLILGLNLAPGQCIKPVIEMTMMPTVAMKRQFNSWQDYVRRLRSPYRRRAFHIAKAFEHVQEIVTGCNAYTPAHHDLYMQIMKHTKDKLEILAYEFFKNLPDCFELTSFYHKEELLCWNITCRDSDQLIFFFGGHDYHLLKKYQSYFNNLFSIIKKFIEGGYEQLDMGQTAEIAKMKIGGQLVPKALFLYHHSAVIRFFLRVFKPMISYDPPKTRLHPFKKHTVHQIKIAEDENIIRKAAPIT